MISGRNQSRILVITRHTPLPGDDGAGNYLFGLLSHLTEIGFRVRLLWLAPHGNMLRRGWCVIPLHLKNGFELQLPGEVAIGRLRLFPNIFYLPWKARTFHFLKLVLTRIGLFPNREIQSGTKQENADEFVRSTNSIRPPQWMALPNPEEKCLTVAALKKFRPDAVITNFCWMNELFACIQNRSVVRVSVTVDVAHERARLLSAIAGDVAPEMDAQEEKRLLEMADLLVAISSSDAEKFRELLPKSDIVVASKAAIPKRFITNPVSGRCLFVGSNNEPNRVGLEWFITMVWPLVKKACPNAHLTVCGTIGETIKETGSNVSCKGSVPDLEEEYQDASVVIVPLLSGSGMKIKLVEACSFGKACVTTSVGLQGLACLEDAVICTDEPMQFAERMCEILTDPTLRQSLETRSYYAALENLSPEVCYRQLGERLKSKTLKKSHREHGAPKLATTNGPGDETQGRETPVFSLSSRRKW